MLLDNHLNLNRFVVLLLKVFKHIRLFLLFLAKKSWIFTPTWESLSLIPNDPLKVYWLCLSYILSVQNSNHITDFLFLIVFRFSICSFLIKYKVLLALHGAQAFIAFSYSTTLLLYYLFQIFSSNLSNPISKGAIP